MFVQVKALKNLFIDFLPRCWILKNKHNFLLTMYQNCLYIEGQLSMLQPTMR